MAKHDKTRAALNTNPVKKNIKFADVDSLLTTSGATRTISGSHHIYRADGIDKLSLKLVNELKPYQVRQARDFLAALDETTENDS